MHTRAPLSAVPTPALKSNASCKRVQLPAAADRSVTGPSGGRARLGFFGLHGDKRAQGLIAQNIRNVAAGGLSSFA
jgi:hypothetical protein